MAFKAVAEPDDYNEGWVKWGFVCHGTISVRREKFDQQACFEEIARLNAQSVQFSKKDFRVRYIGTEMTENPPDVFSYDPETGEYYDIESGDLVTLEEIQNAAPEA